MTPELRKASEITEEIYLRWSMHSITLPNVPSPKVPTISSVREIEGEGGWDEREREKDRKRQKKGKKYVILTKR